jgi:large subunit ribosomal protein L9
VVASADKIAVFEARRAELEQKAKDAHAAAEARAAAIGALKVVIAHKAGDEGRLYGSIGTRDIADAATKEGVPIEKHEVRLPNGQIRTIGEFDIHIHLHSDVVAVLSVTVASE